MTDNRYNNGKVYRLVLGDLVYIGSTCMALSKRKAQHKAHYKSWLAGKFNYLSSFELFQQGNPDIFLIEKVPCNDKMELMRREGYWQDNMKCVNRMIQTGRTKHEYDKVYNAKNKEKKTQQSISWNKEHREEINERNREKVTCECGAICAKSWLLRHLKNPRHAEAMKNKNETSGEDIPEGKYKCGCGVISLIRQKTRHDKTKWHVNWLTKNIM